MKQIHHPWLLIGGTLVAGYALECWVGSEPKAQRDDDLATVKAEIIGFVIGMLWAIVKQAAQLKRFFAKVCDIAQIPHFPSL